uniref:NADH-ubiquinone oxidoreductase chain 5 n=1 Tax=Amblyomma latum TaxID=34617 RepID=A0A977TPW1_9ACAR|nr:NADH dehydrogenase subunit 5 [Amblyomma latum]UXX50167.1 NADH dehydrogenase subunit 5 [Amblyomma latum]
MFIYWSMILLLFSILFMMMFMINFNNSNLLILEYYLICIQNLDFKIYFLMDWMSTMFSSIVLFISSMVIFFSNSYMKNDVNKYSFCLIVILFVLSMVFLILMPNMFMLILGWDGLGLVSYCLVIYYQSVNSFNSGMMTIISNRVGDVMIIMSLIFMMSLGTFDLISLDLIALICGIMVVIAGMTKSAQIPFSAWLPAAMAAPTPVSSLVHSSTLVTAGVYLLMRFNFLFKINFFSTFLLKISLITLLMAGINAFFESDFKKIIAFSTLSQLSLMMISMSLGLSQLAFFHLIMHAVFKSMLFLCAGYVIHSFNGIQDIRMLGSFFKSSPMISSCMMISILSLVGFPFIGGFYSKDLIIEIFLFKMNNMVLLLIFILGLVFSFLYCFRLIYMIMMKGNLNSFLVKVKFDFFMYFSIMLLCILLIVMGNWFNLILMWNFNEVFISKYEKWFFMMLVLFLMYMYMYIKNMNINSDFFFKIWYLSFLTSYILLLNNNKMLKLSLSDWTWMENFGPSMMKNNFVNLLNFNLWLEKKNIMKILMIMLIFIFTMM